MVVGWEVARQGCHTGELLSQIWGRREKSQNPKLVIKKEAVL